VNKIIFDDCKNVLAGLQDGSVKLSLIDPPYNASTSKIVVEKMHYKTVGSKDQDFDYNFDPALLFPEYKRVSENILVFCSYHLLGNYLNIEYPKRILHWYKTNPMPSFRGQPAFSIEYILWYGKKYYGKGSKHDVYKYPICLGKERTEHPTQKPLKLIIDLMQDFSQEGDLVLDGYAGSGTTAVACIQSNRNYICVEKEEKYFSIATKRIEREKSQERLF
jgi:site-specific DNA-methyltransferase (adenine-specific)